MNRLISKFFRIILAIQLHKSSNHLSRILKKISKAAKLNMNKLLLQLASCEIRQKRYIPITNFYFPTSVQYCQISIHITLHCTRLLEYLLQHHNPHKRLCCLPWYAGTINRELLVVQGSLIPSMLSEWQSFRMVWLLCSFLSAFQGQQGKENTLCCKRM